MTLGVAYLYNKSVSQGSTVYTNSHLYATNGYAHVIITSTAGSITVTQQGSFDNINWYDGYDPQNYLLGLVCTAQTQTSGKYIQFSPLLSKYVRFKIVENNVASTTVNLAVYIDA